MKTIRPVNALSFWPMIMALLLTMSAHGQGTFQNLGFESPVLPLVPVDQTYGYVPISNAIPHWTAYLGTDQQNFVLHNNTFLGTAVISLQGPGTTYFPPIQGNYSVLLQPGTEPTTSGPPVTVSAAIGQVGLIPANARSLLFSMSGADFQVSFDGQVIPVSEVGAGPYYNQYRGDISSFAGETGELLFSANSPSFANYLDAISFSSQPVPEPGGCALLFGGGFALALFSRRKW